MSFVTQPELEILERLPDAPTVIDVGAFQGEFTAGVLLARPAARLIAFEAQPQAQHHLRERFGDRVTVYGACGARVESRELLGHFLPTPIATFYPRPQLPMIQMLPVGLIPVTTLDEACASLPHVDLLKIDCEGSEYEVLQGATATLAKTDRMYWEFTTGPGAYVERRIDEFYELLGDGWEHSTLGGGVITEASLTLHLAERRRPRL